LLTEQYLQTGIYPCGGVMKLSKDIGYYNEVDPIVVRQWDLTFSQNGGTVNNHSYKKRELAGVITDPVARADMKRWMMLFYQSKTILGHRRVD
jgi:hypothetical protein